MEIKQAALTHLDEISILFDAYRVFYKQRSDLARARTFIRERLVNKESVIFIALIEERIVGFTQLYPLFSSTRLSRTWLLNDLYVDKEYRGKKISKALIKKAQEFTRNTESLSLSLETAKNNLIGNALYPSMGFVKDREHNFYHWTSKR